MSWIVAPGKDFTLAFLQWRNILLSSIPDKMELLTKSMVVLLHLWWISFFKLMFLVPLSNFTSCCLVALYAEWYCWRISFSWWSNLINLSLLLFCVSGDKLLFSLHSGWCCHQQYYNFENSQKFVLWKCLRVLLLIVLLPPLIDSYSEQLRIYQNWSFH